MIYNTPGVYFEYIDRSRPAVGTLRTDIAGFAGYAERGPLGVPVRLTGQRQFEAVFGQALPFAFLAEAVRGFFDNGGAVCYVVRVADPDRATCASLTLPGANGLPAVRLWASHGELNDPITGAPQVEEGKPVRYESPGAWGNRLAVEVVPGGAGAAAAEPPQPADGQTTQVDNLSGFQAGAASLRGSFVRFVQGGAEASVYRQVGGILPHLLQIEWADPLTGIGLDLARSFRLETVEITLQVLLDGQIVERHPDLSLSPGHSRYLVDVLQRDSNYLDASVLPDETALSDPAAWPVPGDPLPLSSGRDGLTSVTRTHFLHALGAFAKVDEISLLAAPDVVLQVAAPSQPLTLGRGPHCEVLEPLPEGIIEGQVLTIAEDGSQQPVAGVTVTPLNAAAASAVSSGSGFFSLTGLPEGQISLRLERAGFVTLETTAQSRRGPVETAIFLLAAITLPPAFSLEDIAAIQSAMALQGEQGFYRVALLDPPESQLKLDPIQTWRSRFDTAYAALYYPWIVIGSGSETRSIPPSGHIAGLIARTDLSQGVHRAPANFVLEGVKALSHAVNDAEHGLLNAQGINCLRVLPGRGIRVYGARTLSSDPEWRYLNVRRLMLMIEEAVEESTQWVVFEPNNPLLRQILTYSLNSFLNTLWRQGMLAGSTAEAAYRVKCDIDNNPPQVVDSGQIIAEVAVAPTIPFEFIRFRLGRTVEAVAILE